MGTDERAATCGMESLWHGGDMMNGNFKRAEKIERLDSGWDLGSNQQRSAEGRELQQGR